MLRKCKGFALLIILIYLQAISLLSIEGLVDITLARKRANYQQASFDSRQAALRMLAVIDRDFSRTCERMYYSPAYLQKQTFSWWQQHACEGVSHHQRYYYFYQYLDCDPCIRLVDDEHSGKAPVYRLQTLYYPGVVTRLVQDTILLPGNHAANCHQSIRVVPSGRQAIRWLR